MQTFVGVSPQHLAMMGKNPDQVLAMTEEMVALAKSQCADVEFSPMDATRADREFLLEAVLAAIGAGAATINIPDTVGYAVPEEFGELIRWLAGLMSVNAVISVHCHNDLGLATTNTLAALKAGARQAECTINGLGERAGNAALEEIVMAIRTRPDYFRLSTGVETTQIISTSRLVSRVMGIAVQQNKAVVGANAFAHSSGIHQDGVLKNRDTFEVMNPEDVGLSESEITLTARSGRHALKHRLRLLGFTLSAEELEQVYQRFLVLADKKKEVYDEDLVLIVTEGRIDVPEMYHLEYLHTSSGTGTIPSATVRLRITDGNPRVAQEAAWGDGPIDAAYSAVRKAVALPFKLDDYSSRSVTRGQDAIGEVVVKLSRNGSRVTGKGSSTDIIEAATKALIDGLNRLAVLERVQKT